MKLLLDTHTALWFYLADPQLSGAASAAIMEQPNEKWVSPASYWEVAIKISTGKYAIAQPFEDFWRNAIDMNAFQILHIQPRHAAAVATLSFPPTNHRDPFDRLIVGIRGIRDILGFFWGGKVEEVGPPGFQKEPRRSRFPAVRAP